MTQSQNRITTNPYILAMVVMLATFMEILDTSVANVALPHIAGSLSVTVEDSTWVLTTYLASNAIILPITGWLSSKFGRKRYFLGSMFLFTVASLLSGIAPTLTFLLLARTLQGLAGGGLQPVSQAILMESFPEEKRGVANAIFGVGVIFAPILGPVIGGWLTDNMSWRWVFFINLPVGIIALILTYILLMDPPYARANPKLRIDYLALSFIAIGVGSLQIFLDQGQNKDWFNSNMIVILALMAFLFISLFIIKNYFSDEPIIDFSLFKERNYAIGVVLMFFTGFALYGSLMLLPILVQTLMGYTAYKSGLLIAPGGIASLIVMPIAGILSDRVDNRVIVVSSVVIMSYSLYLMEQFNLTASFWIFEWARIVMGFGLPLMFVSINVIAYLYLENRDMGNASGVINFARNIGGSVGISVATTILQRRMTFHRVRLVHNFSQTSHIFHVYLNGFREYLVGRGYSYPDSFHTGIALVNGLLNRNSLIMAFQDDFHFMIFSMIPLFMLAFFIKVRRKNRIWAR